MRLPVVILSSLLMAGCAGHDLVAAPATPPKPTVTVEQICLPLASVTDGQQDLIKKSYDALEPNNILRSVFKDWVRMRDDDRSCIMQQQSVAVYKTNLGGAK